MMIVAVFVFVAMKVITSRQSDQPDLKGLLGPFQDVCVHPNGRYVSFPNQEWVTINDTKSRMKHDSFGGGNVQIQPHPTDSVMFWVDEPTLYLGQMFNNPLHCFMDTIWTLYLQFNRSSAVYSRIHIPDDNMCRHWGCTMLTAYHTMAYGHGIPTLTEELVDRHKDAMVCLRTMYLPIHGLHRPANSVPLLPTELRSLNPELRSFLTRDFDEPKKNILFYDHSTTERTNTQQPRAWQNAMEIKHQLETEGGYDDIVLVHGFTGIPIETQCEIFYDADVIIAAHGAQMANTVCARSGTLVVEVACHVFRWLASPQAETVYHQPMGFEYKMINAHTFVEGEEGHGQCTTPGWDNEHLGFAHDSAFTIRYSVIKEILDKKFKN